MALKKIDTVKRWRQESVDAYGKSVYGAPVNISARYEDKVTEAMNAHGEMIVALGVVYTDTEGDFAVNDRVALGAGANLADSYIVKGMQHDRNGSGTKSLFTAYLTTLARTTG